MSLSCDDISLAVLFFGLGGGTGSSGAPVVGQMLKEKGAKVLGIGVLPSSKQEKDNYTWNAYYSLKNYLSNVDGLILADNNLISKEKELPKLYSMYNDYISGCIFDAVLGPEAEGGKVEHKGMKTVDYTDIINSFSLGKTNGVAAAGMFTKSMKLFGGINDLDSSSAIKNGLNQLTMDVENIEKAKMVWCSVTVHKSLKDKFQFGKLGEKLSELVKKKGDQDRPEWNEKEDDKTHLLINI
jgi:cell division GTPase FtsZ